MKSQIAHNIKHREIANDEFFTPPKLTKLLIGLVPLKKGEIILDPAKGQGVFFNSFPKDTINQATDDFFNFTKKQHWLITNPPYSKIDEWLKHSCEISTKGFAYLLGLHNLTPRRIEMCEKMGFGITKIHLCKVFKWFGISAFIIWQKNKKGIIKYNRKVWR
ncbi:MAG: N-6 DNA methylase [Atribacterota bacterium]|nr:N-6 DNA methylase [Atribacterota bacterium]